MIDLLPQRLQVAIQRVFELCTTKAFALCVAVCLCGILFLELRDDTSCKRLTCRGDFPAFYSGGSLAFTSDLYDPAQQRAVQQAAWPSLEGDFLFFAYPPHAAVLYWPFSSLGAGWGKAALIVSGIIALYFGYRSFTTAPHAFGYTLLTLLVPSTFIGVLAGQNTAWSIAIMAILLSGTSVQLRGIALGLWWFKPQFALIASIVYALHGQWRALLWSMVPLSLYLALATLVQGASWPYKWFAALAWFSEGEAIQNSLRTISVLDTVLRYAPTSIATRVFAALLLLISTLHLKFRRSSPQLMLSLTSIMVVALSPRAMYYELGILTPALVLLAQNSPSRHAIALLALVGVILLLPMPSAANVLCGLVLGIYLYYLNTYLSQISSKQRF